MLSTEELIARGYRRISNKHGMLARIDRSDWIEVLAKHLKRSPAELYAPGEPNPEPCWYDYYRRVLSRDKVTVPKWAAKNIPNSDRDTCGYIAPRNQVMEVEAEAPPTKTTTCD